MTNKIALTSIEEFLKGYVPSYRSIMPMFLQGALQYKVEAGKVDFKAAQTIGDLRARLLGPKDTEIHQIHSNEGTKTFNKYFLGAQYIISQLQDARGVDDVQAQVLDEHNKQSDELFLYGEGTSQSNVKNNGLYWSGDSNYLLKSSAQVEKDTNDNHLSDLYEKIMDSIQESDDVSGRKAVIIYGTDAIKKFGGLFVETKSPLSKVLREAAEGVSFSTLPSQVTLPGVNGYMVLNMDQLKLHYTMLPEILKNGVNEEKMYAWTNFLMGSSMLEVKASKGVIRQPLTFEA